MVDVWHSTVERGVGPLTLLGLLMIGNWIWWNIFS